MSYYYTLLDLDNKPEVVSDVPYDSIAAATDAALDELTTRPMGTDRYFFNVDIHVSPPSEREGIHRTPTEMKNFTAPNITQHALTRIERHNKPEFGVIIETAHADSRRYKEQYEKGLITPGEFAKAKAGIWLEAQYNIESQL